MTGGIVFCGERERGSGAIWRVELVELPMKADISGRTMARWTVATDLPQFHEFPRIQRMRVGYLRNLYGDACFSALPRTNEVAGARISGGTGHEDIDIVVG